MAISVGFRLSPMIPDSERIDNARYFNHVSNLFFVAVFLAGASTVVFALVIGVASTPERFETLSIIMWPPSAGFLNSAPVSNFTSSEINFLVLVNAIFSSLLVVWLIYSICIRFRYNTKLSAPMVIFICIFVSYATVDTHLSGFNPSGGSHEFSVHHGFLTVILKSIFLICVFYLAVFFAFYLSISLLFRIRR